MIGKNMPTNTNLGEIIDPSYQPRGESECLCPVCHRVFGSTEAFDMHRIGEHGVNRRCLNLSSPKVSEAYGLVLESGKWRRDRS